QCRLVQFQAGAQVHPHQGRESLATAPLVQQGAAQLLAGGGGERIAQRQGNVQVGRVEQQRVVRAVVFDGDVPVRRQPVVGGLGPGAPIEETAQGTFLAQ